MTAHGTGMKRSGIRGPGTHAFPDFAALHPGYDFRTYPSAPARQRGLDTRLDTHARDAVPDREWTLLRKDALEGGSRPAPG